MRLLITIPHFFAANSETARHGSHRGSQRPLRAQALEHSLLRLHSLFRRDKVFAVNHAQRGFEAAPATDHTLDIAIVTVAEHHLLADINTPPSLYRHHVVEGDPLYLGFACHSLVKESLGRYDYYGYFEDDLIIYDPMFFDKLNFFNATKKDPVCLFQPHRYELALGESADKKQLAHKVYNDYCGAHQRHSDPSLRFVALGRPITIERSTQPHAGCWFLNETQARLFVESDYFGWRGQLLWNSPLDTAATWGIARVFKVYKTALDSLDFFEVEHACPIVMKQVFPSDGPVPAWVW